jgi:hypothetical protein
LRQGAATFRMVLVCASASLLAGLSRASDAPSLPSAPAPLAAATTRYGPRLASIDQRATQPENDPSPSVERRDAGNHPFWDRKNFVLFTSVGAARALDYSSTLNMRRRGRQEMLLTNDVVDNHPAFLAIEAAGTALSIGASYLFHRYHHHRLERWTSVVHASLATAGAIRNYGLKSAQASNGP